MQLDQLLAQLCAARTVRGQTVQLRQQFTGVRPLVPVRSTGLGHLGSSLRSSPQSR